MAAGRFSVLALLLGACASSGKPVPDQTAALRIGDPPAGAARPTASPAAPSSALDVDDDGVLDVDDFCPNEAEDQDDCDDEDGCPDPDNDGDGVADASDACRNTAGSPNNRGCALPLPPGTRIVVDADGGPCGLILLEPVIFAPNDSVLAANAAGTLEKMAYMLNNCRLVLVFEIRGLSSGRESARLAQQRADVVRADLLGRGVPERKLRVVVKRIPRDSEREHHVEFVVARQLTCSASDTLPTP